MIPNSKAFDGKSSYEYDGKIVQRWYRLAQMGQYLLRIVFVSSNSPIRQGIALFFSDFNRNLLPTGEDLPILKGKFKHYTFMQDQVPNGTILLSVDAEEGKLILANGSEQENVGFDCGAFGCAFWIETIEENHLRFHCNDHEYDDDFDDLIFDLYIEPLNDGM